MLIYFNTFYFVRAKRENPQPGDIVLNKDGSYDIFINNKYEHIDIDTSYITTAPVEFKVKELRPKICVCCRAPLRSNKCEYCGVEYG